MRRVLCVYALATTIGAAVHYGMVVIIAGVSLSLLAMVVGKRISRERTRDPAATYGAWPAPTRRRRGRSGPALTLIRMWVRGSFGLRYR